MPAEMAPPTPALYPTKNQFSAVTNSYSEIISDPLQTFQMLAEATNLYLDQKTIKISKQQMLPAITHIFRVPFRINVRISTQHFCRILLMPSKHCDIFSLLFPT
jgi:hypothetical protein